MTVVRVFVLLLAAATLLFSEPIKLYLKDGGYHVVREYQVQGDRVRFYSVERSEWEEMPVSLVDLQKTEAEHKKVQEQTVREAREIDEEEQAERALHREIQSIPMNSGAYYKDEHDSVKPLPAAEYQVITNKTRKALTYLSPVPIIPGKATVVIKANHSTFAVTDSRPAFYLRLAKEERFGIVQLTPKKNVRVVENVSILPVVNENFEERKLMPTFQQQMQDNLYKVWPEKPLASGEYALVEYAEGDVDMLIWDFAVRPGQ